MTENEKLDKVTQIVKEFAASYWEQLRRQVGQFVPGADMHLPHDIWIDNVLERTMEPQEWLVMAKYGAGLIEADSAYIYEICQGVAEWLFAMPNASTYTIPDSFSDTPFGALWSAAFVRVQGDNLITIAEAAEMMGVSVQAISARIDRGKTLKGYVDPLATNPRSGRRLVKKSDIEKLVRW